MDSRSRLWETIRTHATRQGTPRPTAKETPGYKEEVRRIDGQIAEAMARFNNEVARARKEAAR